MTACTAVIASADALSRGRLRAWLHAHPGVAVVAEAENGPRTFDAVLTHKPDVMYLDVQMPTGTGFEVVRTIGAGRLPLVIFLTAMQDGMTDAFESRSIDYLLKPFDRDRVARSIEHVRLARRDAMAPRLERRLLEFVRALKPAGVAPDDLLLVRSAGRIIFIQPDEIDWVDASGNYVRLHLAGTSYRVRETMDGIERRLDPRRFQRIHRSRIVNLSRIRELRHFADGHQILVLRDGSPMRLGRTYRRELRSRFSGSSLPA